MATKIIKLKHLEFQIGERFHFLCHVKILLVSRNFNTSYQENSSNYAQENKKQFTYHGGGEGKTTQYSLIWEEKLSVWEENLLILVQFPHFVTIFQENITFLPWISPNFLRNVANFTHFVRENKLMKLLFIYPVPLLNTDKIRTLSYKLLKNFWLTS